MARPFTSIPTTSATAPRFTRPRSPSRWSSANPVSPGRAGWCGGILGRFGGGPLRRGEPRGVRRGHTTPSRRDRAGLAESPQDPRRRTGGFKLIRSPWRGDLAELYDLSRDPGEQRNLVGTPGAEAAAGPLARELGRWDSIEPRTVAEAPEADSRLGERLRALGYVD